MRLVEYKCEHCHKCYEELFKDTEEQPEILDMPCPECGTEGSLRRSWNIKKNSQCWRVDV